MASVKLMRCTVPHWQGMDFVDTTVILASDDPRFIPEFFEPIAENAPAKRRAKKAKVEAEFDKSGETYETETKEELREEASARGLPVSGTKETLMDRLEADDAAALEDDE